MGGNEGIYLDLWMEYSANGERRINNFGTFKTLDVGDEAMHTMASLLADFIIKEYAYANANLDVFTWGARHPVDVGSAQTEVERRGADVHPVDGDGRRLEWGYSCGSMERALRTKDELLKKYPQVVVRDNATRKERIFKQVDSKKHI